MNTVKIILLSGFLCVAQCVLADDMAPVEDIGRGDNASLSIVQLQQQVNNLTDMNLPEKINDLRMQIQQLQGQLEEQAHQIDVLKNQQQHYYQDLNRRIGSNAASAVSSDSPSVTDAGSSADSQQQAKTADQNEGPSNAEKKNKQVTVAAQHQDALVYHAAFSQLLAKHYDKASQAFHDYLKAYPTGQFAVNAHYWLGEIAYKQKDYALAKSSFNTVINQYPASNKVADAKLKLGMIAVKTKQQQAAKAMFEALIKAYPKTTAAELAALQLQRLS